MIHYRQFILKLSSILFIRKLPFILNAEVKSSTAIFLGQGCMAGEVTPSSVLLQTRLTAKDHLDASGDLPGQQGWIKFEWSTNVEFQNSSATKLVKAESSFDYIVRQEISSLKPNTRYYYRAHFGIEKTALKASPTCSFKTLAGKQHNNETTFIVGSCMNYVKFMYGEGKGIGPQTATAKDKQLGFPAFGTMLKHRPDFFIGTGDIVYYDNPYRLSETIPELRKCWHEQFRFKRMIDFFQKVPSYWSKDDHDFRYNDSDNTSNRLPLTQTGIDMFLEQLPIANMGEAKPTYRTHRVNQNLQIWLTEGRDHRSPNHMEDGPNKTMWGKTQLNWLKSTLLESDAKWKIIVSPTPMIGPDMASKNDNHTNLGGFRHEIQAFFNWLKTNKIENLFLACGDRHWQYHSIHQSGLEEFACGALNDENSRLGIAPGAPNGTDPKATIDQKFTSPTPQGGFLQISAGEKLTFEHYNTQGVRLHKHSI